MKKAVERQSNFELLRIVAMLFIICCHMMGHTIIPDIQNDLSSNAYIAVGFWIWGGMGVNCFTFISAWFLVNSDFRIQRPVNVWVKTWNYSIILMLLGAVLGLGNYGLGTYVSGALPVVLGEYWYATAWIGMVFISPLLNVAVKGLGKHRWKCLMIVFTIMLSVIPNFIPHLTWYSDLVWLAYCYILVGGIRIYKVRMPGIKKCASIFLISFVLILLSVEATLFLARNHEILYKGLGYFSNRCVFIMLVCSMALFGVFKQLEIKYSRVINIFGGATFGIYLIHENAFVNEYIWNSLLQVKKFYGSNSGIFLLWILLLLVLCFFGCALIDIFMTSIIYKAILKRGWYGRVCDKINRWYKGDGEDDRGGR